MPGAVQEGQKAGVQRRVLKTGAQQAHRPGPPDQEPRAERQDHAALLGLYEGVHQEGSQVLQPRPRRVCQVGSAG